MRHDHDRLCSTRRRRRAADIRELPIPPYRGATLPAIDYDAASRLWRHVPEADAARAALCAQRFPAHFRVRHHPPHRRLREHAAAHQGGRIQRTEFPTALRYVSMFARIRASRMIGTLTGARRPALPANPALLNRIKSDGIVCLTLAPDEIEQIRAVTSPGIRQTRRAPRQHPAREAQVRRQRLLVHALGRSAGLHDRREDLQAATASSKPPAPISAVPSA